MLNNSVRGGWGGKECISMAVFIQLLTLCRNYILANHNSGPCRKFHIKYIC